MFIQYCVRLVLIYMRVALFKIRLLRKLVPTISVFVTHSIRTHMLWGETNIIYKHIILSAASLSLQARILGPLSPVAPAPTRLQKVRTHIENKTICHAIWAQQAMSGLVLVSPFLKFIWNTNYMYHWSVWHHLRHVVKRNLIENVSCIFNRST